MGMNRGGVYRLKGEEISPVVESMAVFSMAPRKNSLVAATTAVICLIGKEGTRHADYPDPEDCEGIQVLSGKKFGIIVLTDIYRSNMISGTVPLVADEE